MRARKKTAQKEATGPTARLPAPQPEPAAAEGSLPLLQRLQATVGNRHTGRWLQAKLKVGPAHDEYEQEADSVADRVMRVPDPAREADAAPPIVQQECAPCDAAAGPLQRKEGGEAAGDAPSIVQEALHLAGDPLDAATRAFMEPRFGHDFGGVRVRSDAQADAAARAVGARAFTVGEDLVFGEGEYSPGTQGGRRLLAHELAHVAQQRRNVLLRALAPDYGTITKNLTYGLFDWAITDAEAHQVLTILAALGPADFRDTLNQMESDGLLTRLLENISDADQTAFAPLIQRIHQSRSVGAISSHIENLMSYGLLDWVITDAEARLALQALLSLRPTPDKLRDVVVRIPSKQWERFFDNLPDSDRAQNLRFTQDLEMMRRTGMTLDQMSEAQKSDLEAKAAAAGVSVGTFIRGEASARGYGGFAAVWWPSLTAPEKAAWTARFNTVLVRIKAAAPQELKRIISSAEAAGGGIFFLPQEVEELGPSTYAFREGNKLGVGKVWLETAENNPPDVFENIAHELGGHLEYGATASWDIMKGTLAKIPPGEKAIAESGPRHLYSAYQYMETEIYAELRELPYRTPGSRGDEPEQDVEHQLQNLKAAFAANVAEAIVRGMRRRIQLDDRISGASRDLFDDKVKSVFGITF